MMAARRDPAPPPGSTLQGAAPIAPGRLAAIDNFVAGLSPSAYQLTAHGVRFCGRNYVTVACHCGLPAGFGWAIVHDDPAALAHFKRLFGAPRHG